MKRKIKKIFFEVISNSKIFNIIFFSTKLSTTKILPNLQGTRKRGGLDKVKYNSSFTLPLLIKSSPLDKIIVSLRYKSTFSLPWLLDLLSLFVYSFLSSSSSVKFVTLWILSCASWWKFRSHWRNSKSQICLSKLKNVIWDFLFYLDSLISFRKHRKTDQFYEFEETIYSSGEYYIGE